MDRRDFIFRTGTALAGAAGLAGCLGGGADTDTPTDTYDYDTPSPSPTPAVVSTNFTWSTPQAGELVVSLTLRNQTSSEQTAEVTVRVAFGDDERKQTKTVSVDADATADVEFSFDRPADAPQPAIRVNIETTG